METYRKRFYKYQSIAKGESNIETVKNNFDKMLSIYDALFGDILKNINVSDNILDLGCGMGNLCYFLTKKGFRDVKGVDFDGFSVNIATNQLGLNVINDDFLHFLKMLVVNGD